MNEDKKKDKELLKEIKKVNASLSFLSKNWQDYSGVLAVQKKDQVYYCKDNIYKKVYMFEMVSFINKGKALIDTLIEKFDYRIRFSIYFKNNNKLNAFIFMTVSFKADSYYDADIKINEFETAFYNDICKILGIKVSVCRFDSAVTYINMNFKNELKDISQDIFFNKRKKCDLGKMMVLDPGYIESDKRYNAIYRAVCFLGIEKTVNDYFYRNNGDFNLIIDVQHYTEEEQRLYLYNLKTRYSLFNDISVPGKLVNITYMIQVISDNKERLIKQAEEITDHFNKNGIVLVPISGNEVKAYKSIGSFGLMDYRAMQNIISKSVGNLMI